MTHASNVTGADYDWFENEASCFTFLRSVASQALARGGVLKDVRDVDLTGVDDALSEFAALDGEPDTAVFEAGNGWTVVYQDNCFPAQFVGPWLASPSLQQGVVVFWNVNGSTEFSIWENGVQRLTFGEPYERLGAEPDLLNATMRRLGIPLEAPTDDDVDADNDNWFASDGQLMALAETVTGVHLDEGFLARPLVVGRVHDDDLRVDVIGTTDFFG